MHTLFICRDQLREEVIHTPKYLYESTWLSGELLTTMGEDGRVGESFLETTINLHFIALNLKKFHQIRHTGDQHHPGEQHSQCQN